MAIPPGLHDVFEKPDSSTLFTIGNKREYNLAVGANKDAAVPQEVQTFQRTDVQTYYVIDKVELSDAELAELTSSFKTAYFAGEDGGVMCFEPHHALRLRKGDEVLDLLICFMCHNYAILPGGGYNNVHMSRSTGMEAMWRAIVRKHGLRDVSDKEN